ncbi:uncharacterized protein METZ01_LOCUS66624 [marine metagenome]|uniref:Uncharacterized protein n=1 Tax=marine metagenome TaxID=408172 RepID=A0A381TCC4_9ZZZZ
MTPYIIKANLRGFAHLVFNAKWMFFDNLVCVVQYKL